MTTTATIDPLETTDEVEALGQAGTPSPRGDARYQRLRAAQAELAAVKAATAAGQEPPPTPNHDQLKENLEMGTTGKTKTTTREPGVKQSTRVRFTHDGMPMHESHMLGGVAFHYTAGLGDKGPDKKLDSKGLTALLTKLGVKDLFEPGWEVTLSNGIKIGAIRPDQVDEYRARAKEAGTRSTTKPKTEKADKPDRQKARDAAADATDVVKSPSGGVTKKPAGATTGASKPTGTVKKQTPGAKTRAAAKRPATPKASTGKPQATPIPKAKDVAKVAASA